MNNNTAADAVAPLAPLTITDPQILDFFRRHPYIVPTRFLQKCVEKFERYVDLDDTTHVLRREELRAMRAECDRLRQLQQNMKTALAHTFKEQMRFLRELNTPVADACLSAALNGEPHGTAVGAPTPHPFFGQAAAAGTTSASTSSCSGKLGGEFLCPHCKKYRFLSKRSMAAHARICRRKKDVPSKTKGTPGHQFS